MFLRTFFSENDDFERETKIVPREKNTVKVKQALRKATIIQMRGQPRGLNKTKRQIYRTFYGKSRGETNSI
jgi:hypothetical protein